MHGRRPLIELHATGTVPLAEGPYRYVSASDGPCPFQPAPKHMQERRQEPPLLLLPEPEPEPAARCQVPRDPRAGNLELPRAPGCFLTIPLPSNGYVHSSSCRPRSSCAFVAPGSSSDAPRCEAKVPQTSREEPARVRVRVKAVRQEKNKRRDLGGQSARRGFGTFQVYPDPNPKAGRTSTSPTHPNPALPPPPAPFVLSLHPR